MRYLTLAIILLASVLSAPAHATSIGDMLTERGPRAIAIPILPLAPNQSCDPNYSDCVPIASDVDCAGGSGNGPAYVSGPIRVIGTDIYELDRNGDGVACE